MTPTGRPTTRQHSRRIPARVRRTRAAVVVTVVVVLAVIVAECGHSTTPNAAQSQHGTGAATTTSATPAVEAGLLPWKLSVPVSRMAVTSGAGSDVVILGGLSSGSVSDKAVFTLDTSNGTLTQVGDLADPVHDGAGAVIGGQDVVLGGGSPATFATVQGFPAPGTSAGSGTAAGTVLGSLPAPRSDDATATVGKTTYVVGGYDGTNADPDVLATTDGRSFHRVCALSVPVRYPAVAAVGGLVYAFGGEAISGSSAGQPTDVIQAVDPGAGTCRVVGHLPYNLEAAVALTVGGTIYLAGGDSTNAPAATPGVGTTQLVPGRGSAGAGASGAINDAFTPATGPPAVEAAAQTTLTSVTGIWAFDPGQDRVLDAGRLQVPVSHAGAAVSGNRGWIIGGESGGTQVGAVQMFSPDTRFGTAGAQGAGSPYFGDKLLVADRGNNRFLLFDAAMNLVWTYPSATSPPDPLGFYFPDDAFFIDKGTAIISNQEENETIVEIAYPSGRVIWSYGHPKQTGTGAGYLHEPDDAYLLKNGDISVADAQNCRVLVLSQGGSVLHQIGTNGRCVHDPPMSMGSPNGDTPLADGNLLISEINGTWISEYTLTGSLVWTTHLPITYPSDPQQLAADLYLVADYARPGQLVEFNRAGAISYQYDVTSGPGELDHPSLAEQLPSGAIMINDDYANRMVAIDPTTDALVWQYGLTDVAGTAPGMLNTPDGFDVLAPDGSTPTHSATG